jgi:protoporphyrin/coproporphyrin ferrochelatase
MSNREIVLLQMGGPATLAELRPFYERLFRDPDLIRLPSSLRPVQPALAWLLARLRTGAMRHRYSQIGGGSPLLRHTNALARALERELTTRVEPSRVHVAMRYSAPSAGSVVADLQARGVSDALLFPLYPHWSNSTSGSSITDFLRAVDAAEYRGRIGVIQAWGDAPGYLELLQTQIAAARAALESEWDGPIHLLFSAHGLPVRYVRSGDPYPVQVRRTAEAVAARVDGFAGWRLSFQSRMGPVQWLQPSTDRALKQLAAEDATAIVAVPLGFVSDHIETLYDLDILYRGEASALGVKHYRRVPSFNADPAFAKVIADIIDECNATLTPAARTFTAP